MAMERVVEARPLAWGQNNLSRKLRRMALAVPAIALLAGAAAMAFEPRFGLFATALIVGWTQLVGL